MNSRYSTNKSDQQNSIRIIYKWNYLDVSYCNELGFIIIIIFIIFV